MTPQSVGAVDRERRLVEEFYYRSIPVNTGLILAPLLSVAVGGVFKIASVVGAVVVVVTKALSPLR